MYAEKLLDPGGNLVVIKGVRKAPAVFRGDLDGYALFGFGHTYRALPPGLGYTYVRVQTVEAEDGTRFVFVRVDAEKLLLKDGGREKLFLNEDNFAPGEMGESFFSYAEKATWFRVFFEDYYRSWGKTTLEEHFFSTEEAANRFVSEHEGKCSSPEECGQKHWGPEIGPGHFASRWFPADSDTQLIHELGLCSICQGKRHDCPICVDALKRYPHNWKEIADARDRGLPVPEPDRS